MNAKNNNSKYLKLALISLSFVNIIVYLIVILFHDYFTPAKGIALLTPKQFDIFILLLLIALWIVNTILMLKRKQDFGVNFIMCLYTILNFALVYYLLMFPQIFPFCILV